MNKKDTLKRLNQIGFELGNIANDCAIKLKDENNNAGVFLHEAANNVWKAERCLNGENEEIPMEIINRSVGMDIGEMALGLSQNINGIAKDLGSITDGFINGLTHKIDDGDDDDGDND